LLVSRDDYADAGIAFAKLRATSGARALSRTIVGECRRFAFTLNLSRQSRAARGAKLSLSLALFSFNTFPLFFLFFLCTCERLICGIDIRNARPAWNFITFDWIAGPSGAFDYKFAIRECSPLRARRNARRASSLARSSVRPSVRLFVRLFRSNYARTYGKPIICLPNVSILADIIGQHFLSLSLLSPYDRAIERPLLSSVSIEQRFATNRILYRRVYARCSARVQRERFAALIDEGIP